MDIQEILHAIEQLDSEQLDRISQYIDQQKQILEVQANPRILNLHSGAITTTDDFDSPLPESFWLE